MVIFIRIPAGEGPDGLPALPATLWASTAILVLSAITMHRALHLFRRGRSRPGSIALLWTAGLAVIFLVLQVVSWFQWTQAVEESGVLISTHQLASSTFLLLTEACGPRHRRSDSADLDLWIRPATRVPARIAVAMAMSRCTGTFSM